MGGSSSWGHIGGPGLNAPRGKPLTPKPEPKPEPPARLVVSVREKIAEFKRRKAERQRGV